MVKSLAAIIFGIWISLPAFAVIQPGRAPQWDQLNPEQRAVLAPLVSQWNHFPEFQKKKLLGVAKRFPQLSPVQQKRVQSRLQEWSKLTPEERSLARKNFQNLKNLPPEERKAVREKWLRYRPFEAPGAHPGSSAPSAVPPTTASPGQK